ncbi:ATP-dependent RNA helicase SUPV3L1, mitochondrial [Tupaia chinensis]|uniref:ATP-dependent RNA helicase SUPV3L1, mitochondrial n=1 Tax=Tupaia chinensis TaxID=246437 RepID=L9KS11_TUPCH|nr:ATP-dependent RNA helicase SUPV3L1, mitochondrial [Tupaia chinensis]
MTHDFKPGDLIFAKMKELFNDKSNTHEFVNLVKELALPGELTQSRSYDFEFMQVEKPYESYIGANVRLRYFLKVTIVRRLTDLVKEYDLIVHQLATYPDVNNSIKMEVGIEDCLHIEFEYNKSKYHLKDVIVGKIYFLLVRIKIQHMELQLIKKEITGIGPSTTTETETIAKYEIMDGAPVKAPNTSLFVPLPVKPQGPSADGDVGAELTRPLDKNEVKKILDKFYKRKEVQKLGADYGLDGLCAEEVHLCGESAAIDLVTELMYTTGEEVEVRTYDRLTPISVLDRALETLDNLRPGDCIVCFSKNDIYSVSRQIEIRGLESAVIYGSLPPGTKLAQAKKFNDPDDPCKILVATDAIGMGLNLSIKRIIFYSLMKPSINEKGEREIEPITTSQALQIAGRAGRFSSQFKEGEVTTMNREDLGLLKEILNRPVDPIRDIFVDFSQVDGQYFVCNMDDFKFSAELIQHIPLSLRVSYRFLDMFPDASLIRDLQKELDGIIQEGVHNITKLIKISETHKLLNLESLSAVNQSQVSGTSKSQARRMRGTKAAGSKAAEPLSPNAGELSLASRLVQQGLLTPDMLKQLEKEWLSQQTEDSKERTESGTYSKGTRRKKKEPDSE